MTYDLTHHGSILLLHVSIIVGTFWATPGKGNLFFLAIGQQDGIEKLATMTRIQAKHWKWQQITCPLKGHKDSFRAAIEQGEAFRPASSDVRQRQGVQIAAKHVAATMRDQICFQKAGPIIVPLGKGTDGDLVFKQRSRLCGGNAMRGRPTLRAKQPFGGSHTHCQDLAALFFTEPEMSISLQDRNQTG